MTATRRWPKSVTHGAESRLGTGPDVPSEAGLSLIELLVALTVFALLAGGLVLLVESGLGLARNNRNRSIAANLASQEMDAVRQAKFTTLPLGLVSSNVAVDSVNYVVNRNSEWVNNNSAAGACDSGGGIPKVLRVSVDVSWPDMRGIPPARSSTVITPPVGSYDPNTGHIAVKVRNGSAAPLGGVPVRVVGPGVDKTVASTDALAASPGCAFFPFLPAGSYTVTLGLSGYVDRQGNASPTQTAGVVVGATSSVAFDYDLSSSLLLTIQSPDGGTPVSTLPISLGNTAYLPSGTKVFTGSGLARTLSDLFPYTDGYEAWAGDCADADPEGKDSIGTPFWPGAQRAPAFDTDPGSATTGTVALPSVDVNFELDTGTTGTLIAVHGSDNGCPGGATYTLATYNTATASGRFALPYGTWTLQISGKSPHGSWPVVSLDPSSGTVQSVLVRSL